MNAMATSEQLRAGQVFIDDELLFWRVRAVAASADPGQVLVRVESGPSVSQLNHLRVLVRPEFDELVRERDLVEIELN
jgi:hypothetical protein